MIGVKNEDEEKIGSGFTIELRRMIGVKKMNYC